MPSRADWQVLGLEPGADLDEVHHAYHRRRSLYREESLATYSLFDDGERQSTIDRIEAAYRRIVDRAPSRPTAAPAHSPPEQPSPPLGPEPDPEQNPGGFLRHRRLTRGLTLERIANETKIRAAQLDALEDGAYDKLPAQVYVRGFVIQLAKLLQIDDPDDLAHSYLARMEGGGGSG